VLDPRHFAPHAIAHVASTTPDAVAIQHVDGPALTYGQLDVESRTWADALRRLGVAAGTHVGTMLTNRFEAHRTMVALGWLRAIEDISIIGAFLIGIYSATYPLVVAAAGEILRDDLSSSDEALLAVLFVILGSSTVIAVAALGTFASSRSAPFLSRMRAWLTVHNAAVMTGILLLFGFALTVRGLQSL